MWPFTKNKCYFFVFEIEIIEKDKSLPASVLKYLKKYLKLRFKKINYFEPAIFNDTNYIIVGSEEVKNKTNRNVLIFLLELYASLKDPSLKVTNDFKKTDKKIGKYKVIIYKFKRFK